MEKLETMFDSVTMSDLVVCQDSPIPSSLPSSPVSICRKRSEVEKAVLQRLEAAKEFTSHLPPQELPTVNAYIPPMLENAIFCGHLVSWM